MDNNQEKYKENLKFSEIPFSFWIKGFIAASISIYISMYYIVPDSYHYIFVYLFNPITWSYLSHIKLLFFMFILIFIFNWLFFTWTTAGDIHSMYYKEYNKNTNNKPNLYIVKSEEEKNNE